MRLGKLLSYTHWPSRRNPCTDARRAETYVAPTHVDASHVFFFTFFERAASGGGGGGAASHFFSSSYSADHERDWPPCKSDFSGWQPTR